MALECKGEIVIERRKILDDQSAEHIDNLCGTTADRAGRASHEQRRGSKMKQEQRDRSVRCLVLLSCIMGATQLIASTADQSPRQYCAQIVNDDQPRPAPLALAVPIQHLFGISGKYALETTSYRCAGGHVMLCTVGANLSCDKADTRSTLPPATEWCRTNPNSDFIPMAVTGHDTAYVWRCVGGVAKPSEKVGPIDERGFFSKNWKELK